MVVSSSFVVVPRCFCCHAHQYSSAVAVLAPAPLPSCKNGFWQPAVTFFCSTSFCQNGCWQSDRGSSSAFAAPFFSPFFLMDRITHYHDPSAITNHRVKGSLKVTRAFGGGFLKHQKWNDALLDTFRVDYVGNSPYAMCSPSMFHNRLIIPDDMFLILSSDGLYQYFTDQEAVSEVETFMSTFPEGDPAQHLVEEVLFRAAKKAGMDFHELLDIPQGDRRRYHDDVSIIIISFQGRIWRSYV
ncbi:hypothetical protein M569_00691 [Genlisea aurea]|uniref:PPM-type phosphatase domain-containing protein n=1 Tax=Genlisea aurea TaxID=192259 RepID=S8D2W0_9LAMI|nr:hypothetical protein M569_00691 [Genlisea aurea]